MDVGMSYKMLPDMTVTALTSHSESPPLLEEQQMTAAEGWRRSHSPLGTWLLVGCLNPSGWPHTQVLMGSTNGSQNKKEKEDMKLGGMGWGHGGGRR